MNVNESKATREEAFLNSFFSVSKKDKGFAARMRRADNPSTEYQSWDFLARFGINLENPNERIPYVVIVSAAARAKAVSNGNLTFGRAIALCYPDGNKSDQAAMKLRRILASSDIKTLSRVIRPVLTLIDSRVSNPLDYARLLHQLKIFCFDDARVKAQWAQEFYA